MLALAIVILLMYGAPGVPAADGATVSVDSRNPRYFSNGSGKAIYMAGSATWFILYENVHPIDRQRASDFLDWLQSWGHDYTRVWSFPFYVTNTAAAPDTLPYRRTGPGRANDGELKFDLTRPNEAYFELVRDFLAEIETRGMYCSIMLFGSGISFREKGAYRKQNAWHPENNVNPATNAIKTGADFYAMAPGLLALQEDHVRRVIDLLNPFDNFVWEIINEAELPASKQWQYHMIRYIRDYEKTKPKQHLIIMSGGNNEANGILEDSPADIISPDASFGDYRRGGPAAYDDKIVVNDTDHLWGFSKVEQAEVYRKWVWKTFLRGNHPIFMDDYDSFINGNNGKINPAYDGVRKNMGDTIDYARRFADLARMLPDPEAASTRYALVDPGREYLVYFPGDDTKGVKKETSSPDAVGLIGRLWSKFTSQPQPGARSFTVKLRPGTYLREWFDPMSAKRLQDTLTCGKDGPVVFDIPAEMNDDVVVYLKRVGDTG
ncbi:MAG: DUF6298 domain-containing protein [Desulfobacterales bacterium]